MKTYRLSEILSKLKYQNVSSGNFENLLSYYSDSDDSSVVSGNLNTGIKLIIDDESLLETFHLNTDMFWPQISQKIYETDTLYWFLILLNPNKTTSLFSKIKAPDHIKYLPDAMTIIRNAG